MKKIPALCLAIAAILYSSAAFSRICFLADTDCQAGQFKVDADAMCREQNPNWLSENELCKDFSYGGVVCNDATGNYYEDVGCPEGYTDIRQINQNKYECDGSLLCNRCCRRQDLKCRPKYNLCTEHATGVAPTEDDVCEDSEGTKYITCKCDSKVYNAKCDVNGLQGDSSDVCIDSDAKIWYKSCMCAQGWLQVPRSSINCPNTCPDNCRLNLSVLLPGTGDYCWEGAECLDEPSKNEQCLISYQSNFDNFWSGYDVNENCRNLTVNCSALGYDTGIAGSSVKCADGSEPFRCPFDHTQVYCASGIASSCQFSTKAECELSYFGSVCTVGTDRCYKPSACKSGYAKSVANCSGTGNWTLGSVDAFGCGACQKLSSCDESYNLASCPDNAACDVCEGKYKFVKCNDGYALQIGVAGSFPVCQKTYSSCEDAGAFETAPENGTCLYRMQIALHDGSPKQCLSGCECNDGYVMEMTTRTCHYAGGSMDCTEHEQCMKDCVGSIIQTKPTIIIGNETNCRSRCPGCQIS